jgi:hypothetical protein
MVWPTSGYPNEENTKLALVLVPLLPAFLSLVRVPASLCLLRRRGLPPYSPARAVVSFDGSVCAASVSKLFCRDSPVFLRAFSAALFRIRSSRHATGSVAAWIRSDYYFFWGGGGEELFR